MPPPLRRLLGQLGMPLPIGLGLAALPLLLRPSPGGAISLAALLLLALVSTPRVGRMLLEAVKRRCPRVEGGWGENPGGLPRADALVVLSGGFPQRDLWALSLYRHGRAPVLVFSGHSSAETAERRHQMLTLAGIEPHSVLQEPHSRNTDEGGRAFRRLATERNWRSALLVSDRDHLPRALRAYGSAAVEVIAAPCPETKGRGAPAAGCFPAAEAILGFVPGVEGLADTSRALRELLGSLLQR